MNLSHCLELNALTRGTHPGLFFREQPMSYAAMDDLASKVAAALERAGIRRGDRVALYLPNCPEFICCFYGILKLGAVVVPMNILFRALEIEHLLKHSEARILIADVRQRDEIAVCLPSVATLETVLLLCPMSKVPTARADDRFEDFWQRLEGTPSRFPGKDMTPDESAAILYTSGTTGNPKGAMLTHYNFFLNAECYKAAWKLDAGTFAGTASPLSHLLSLMGGMIVMIQAGGSLYLLEKFDPEETARTIRKFKINYFMGVPTIYYMLNALPVRPEFDMSSLRVCKTAGAIMAPEIRGEFERRTGALLVQLYGLTETSPGVTMDVVGDERRLDSVGKALPHIDVRIVDDNDTPLPVGQHGEICCRGHCVMKGYFRDPAATERAMRDRWFHTGDIGMIDDHGFMYIFDRKKDLIICGGYNIYPLEVENLLYEHPAVLEAAVVGVADPRLGEVPVAYVALKRDSRTTVKELMDSVNTRIASYKRIRALDIVPALPKGPTGKILRRALRAPGNAAQAQT